MRYLVVFVIFQFSPAVPAALLLSRLFPVLFLSASDSPRSKEQVRTNRTTYYVRSTNKSIGLHSTILGSPILWYQWHEWYQWFNTPYWSSVCNVPCARSDLLSATQCDWNHIIIIAQRNAAKTDSSGLRCRVAQIKPIAGSGYLLVSRRDNFWSPTSNYYWTIRVSAVLWSNPLVLVRVSFLRRSHPFFQVSWLERLSLSKPLPTHIPWLAPG